MGYRPPNLNRSLINIKVESLHSKDSTYFFQKDLKQAFVITAPLYLWARCRRRAGKEQVVNQVAQISNVDCAITVDVTLLQARRRRA